MSRGIGAVQREILGYVVEYGEFTGLERRYIASWTQCARQSLSRAIKSLLGDGYITERTDSVGQKRYQPTSKGLTEYAAIFGDKQPEKPKKQVITKLQQMEYKRMAKLYQFYIDHYSDPNGDEGFLVWVEETLEGWRKAQKNGLI